MRKREDSYFGIHFDFHATESDIVGIIYKPEIVAEALDRIKPDFVQCDTKGHDGISSYPTKIGNRGKIKHDVLKMWRKLTKERDIALYAHHSGLYDKKIIEQHPDWAVCDENGTKNDNFISVFSPYVDEILIPQLIELVNIYELDGAWIDGDCWCLKVDYSYYAVAKWREMKECEPPKSSDEGYEEYREFCRQGFKNYVLKYVTAIKARFPEFRITSNWMYSAYMPEAVTEPIDFLSGDYESQKSVASGRINGRVLAARKLPWELMAWGQNLVGNNGYMGRNRSTKEYVQYCQEAAQIISLGGAFEFFNIMYGNGGTIQEWALPTWEKVAKFCREREAFCFKAESVKQTAVLLAENRTPSLNEGLYNLSYPEFLGCEGWINALLDSQISSEVLLESEMSYSDLKEYPIIIIPSVYGLKAETVEKLKKYAQDGGKIITDGGSVKHFEDFYGVNPQDICNKLVFLSDGERLAPFEDKVYEIKKDKSKPFGELYPQNFYTEQKAVPAAHIGKFGRGTVCALSFDLGMVYRTNKTPVIRAFVRTLLKRTGFEPRVKVTGSGFVDVTLMQKNKCLMVNLINYAGTHNDTYYRTYDEIPPLYYLKVSVKCDMPKKIYLEPEHKRLEFTYKNGEAHFTVDKLEIHSIVTIEV